jgi:hypothetical protein
MSWTAAGVKMYLREDITMDTIFGKRMGAGKQRKGIGRKRQAPEGSVIALN